MKKYKFFLMLLSSIVLSSCFIVQEKGSGKLETKTYDFSGFSELSVYNTFEATVVTGQEFSIKVILDDNLYEFLEVAVKGSCLNVGLKSGKSYRTTTAEVYIQMPVLTSLKISGAGEADVSGFDLNTFDLRVSGASRSTLSDLRVVNLNAKLSGASTVRGSLESIVSDVKLSGASKIKLKGTGTLVSIKCSGASKADLEDFEVKRVPIADISGASSVSVSAGKIEKLEVSGASSFEYSSSVLESGIEEQDVSGASKVKSF